LKFATLIFSGVAALALPMAAMAETPTPTAATQTSATLFPGSLDMPVVNGAAVPADCAFPASLQTSNVDLACIITTGATREDEVGIEYVAWLGQNGWRYSADIVGGFMATRTDENGCERSIGVYPHGEGTEQSGIWFALVRDTCAASAQAR